MMVEVHPDPAAALSDGPQQLDGAAFGALMEAVGVTSCRNEIDAIDREIVRLIARRREHAVAIAETKAARGLALRTPEREAELLSNLEALAGEHGIDPGDVRRVFELLLRQSRREQRRRVAGLEMAVAAGIGA
jgi:chorismate mutase